MIRTITFFDLFCDAVKRCALTHILKYSENLVVKKAVFQIIDKSGDPIVDTDVSDLFVLYSVLPAGKITGISENLSENAVLEKAVTIRKSKQGNGTSSLYAYLFAKSKQTETEKFSFLWMAFNGFCNEVGKEKNGDKGRIDETLKKLGFLYSLMTKTQRDAVGFNKMLLLAKKIYSPSFSKDEIEKNKSILEQEVRSLFSSADLEWKAEYLYPFLLVDFSYTIRCNMFHADKPLLLLSVAHEMEYKALCIANSLLEEFLDAYIAKLFTKTSEISF